MYPQKNSQAHQLSYTLLQLTRLYLARLNVVAGKYGITPDQLLILHTLSATEGRWTIGKITRLVAVQQPAVSKAMMQFERRQLVASFTSSTDKRKKEIEITPAGRALLGEIQNRLAHNLLPFLTQLEEQELATMNLLSQRVISGIAA